MSVRPIAHFTWQVLRTAKRAKKAPTGRQLRVAFNRRSKDGTFLTQLVTDGLLVRVTGSADAPFEATYRLTELGEHAAEYGEYDHAAHDAAAPPAEPPAVAAPKPTAPKARKRTK